MSNYDEVYRKLPVWAQNAAVSGYGAYWHWLRFGTGFKQFETEFRQREQFSSDEWQAWMHDRLVGLLSNSVERVPYYAEAYTNLQKQAAREGNLGSLPFLEKEVARNHPRLLLRRDISQKEFISKTSGTTGTPIDIIWTRSEKRRSLALREVRSAKWAGVSFFQPRATFSGRLVEPDPDSKGPYYRFNKVERQVYFSAFHLKPSTARAYVDALWKHKIEWMTGYAVSYYLLARYILDQGINIPPLKAVVTTSEKLTPEMRFVIEEAYRCRAFEEYSTVENALFASECELGSLHVSPDAGVIEILRPDGHPCDPEEVGEVVTTGLIRDYQPLIRYRLGDLAAWAAEPCECGRNMPVIKEVVGRIEDLVTGPDGRQMVRFHGIFIDQPNIQEGQIIQKALDHIHVKIVPGNGFAQDDIEDVINRVKQRLGGEVRVTVESVASIPRTSSGKFKAVVSEIK